MKISFIFVVISLAFSLATQAQKCSESIKNNLGITASFCPDGSVTFEQPSSKPLKLNILKFRSELMSMMTVPKLESFPDQYREPVKDSGHTKKKPKDDKKEDTKKPRRQSLKEMIENYSKMIAIAEGRCGQTAASNVFAAYCGNRIISPDFLAKEFFKDSAPGVHPSTLTSDLNEIFKTTPHFCQQGKWNYYYSENKFDFLDSLYHHSNYINADWRAKDPVIVLLSTDEGESLHYVTVTNIEGYCPESALQNHHQKSCYITYNDDNSQTKVSCSDFVKLVEDIQINTFFKAFIKKYPRIVFKAD